MSTVPRILCSVAVCLVAASFASAQAPQESPFNQSKGTRAVASVEGLEFAGVTTVGKKAMINLYDTQQRRSFWVATGATAGGVTVLRYDEAHNQVVVRHNGVEKTLALRSAAVAAAPATGAPVGAAALPAPQAPATALPPPPPVSQLSQARQEEEARMLVSDLLEIGMAQRRAYEEARRKAAAGQSTETSSTAGATPTATANAPIPVAPAPGQPAAPAPTGTPSGG
ncbi:hypothetical protein [Opitutus sp. ER46]|uniref:hypothetical protein n=1 Tax=Opitutus sp. ER46 TaxID=2161864 RepID=UPI000D315E35|nr:hypothetical protein [Opitutus sp. ER46]PTX97718.1 hypothetical protein DB354_05405 [Opitutus sp. ER46]